MKWRAGCVRSIAAVVGLSVLIGCGSGSRTSAPLHVAPRFTSIPPNVALEGTTYSYDIGAVSNQHPIAFTLTSAPQGAMLVGTRLTWTPTRQQSRVPNLFVVTAASDGASETQTWSVIPRGTVSGSYIDTLWSEAGQFSLAHDLSHEGCSWCSFAALVPSIDGTIEEVRGAGYRDGTFQIPNVPGGFYWLQISEAPSKMFWTGSSTFELGKDFVGKLASSAPRTVKFDLSGLAPWQTDSSMLVISPGVGAGFYPAIKPSVQATTFIGSEQDALISIDPLTDGPTYILQYQPFSAAGITGKALGPSLVLRDFRIGTEDPVSISGELTELPRTLDVSLRGSEWNSAFENAGPNSAQPYGFFVQLTAQPVVKDMQVSGRILLLQTAPQAIKSFDIGLSALSYSDPFPPEWLRIFSANAIATVQVPVPGSSSTVTFPLISGFQAPAVSSPPLVPALLPIRNASINGSNLFSENVCSVPVRLNWTASSSVAYIIQLYQLRALSGGSFVYEGPIASLYTAKVPIEVPTRLLSRGNTYVLRIETRSDTGSNIESAPMRSGLLLSYSDAVSGPVTIAGTPNE